jgi:carbamoyl-phosphate synthase small subunit
MRLILDDGTEFAGRAYGAPAAVAGEVVFNTGLTGYVETLTDPSYRGQILVLTYPLIGNYGVPAPRDPGTIDRPFESGQIQVQALVVQHYTDHFSHHASTRSLAEWLRSENVPLLSGVDTRALTQKLREKGTMRGWLLPSEGPDASRERAREVEMRREVFRLVAPREVVRYPGGKHSVLLVDAGAKDNLVRSLKERDTDVVRAPYHADIVRLAAEADGVLIGNGPGDPKDLEELTIKIRDLLGSGYAKPIFGVCLGNQILALAAGADTAKLPYGHRGVNQPVQDLLTRRCFITSQNHGYAVRDGSLPSEWEPWFVNLNDGTNEGIRHRSKPYFSVQFHPEASPGPEDTRFLFDDFLRLVRAARS